MGCTARCRVGRFKERSSRSAAQGPGRSLQTCEAAPGDVASRQLSRLADILVRNVCSSGGRRHALIYDCAASSIRGLQMPFSTNVLIASIGLLPGCTGRCGRRSRLAGAVGGAVRKACKAALRIHVVLAIRRSPTGAARNQRLKACHALVVRQRSGGPFTTGFPAPLCQRQARADAFRPFRVVGISLCRMAYANGAHVRSLKRAQVCTQDARRAATCAPSAGAVSSCLRFSRASPLSRAIARSSQMRASLRSLCTPVPRR